MFSKDELFHLYQKEKLSSAQIAARLKCSENKVNYWIAKYNIPKRSIGEAIYQKWNPDGDPFTVRQPRSIEEGILYGLGVGLYWGEGTKASKTSVKLSNSDPRLIKRFIHFLGTFYQIDVHRLRFGLQVFGDMDPLATKRIWMRALGVSGSQFYPKIIVTPHRGVGSYRKKTLHGVLTVYFNNKKLRDIICRAIEEESMR